MKFYTLPAAVILNTIFDCVAGNLASYLDLQPIDAVYVPVPINFIFIGFSGSGNHGKLILCWGLQNYLIQFSLWKLTVYLSFLGIKLSESDLKKWFEHMDHIFEHTRVPVDWESQLDNEAFVPKAPHLSPVSPVHFK